MRHLLPVLASFAALVVACSDGSSADSAMDADPETATDAPAFDGPVDTEADVDAGADASRDARLDDARFEVGDAGDSDASDTRDASDAAGASPFPLVDPPPGFSGLTSSPPLTLTGATSKTLSRISITNPSGPCIVLHGGADVVLDHVALGPCKGDGVSIDGHAARMIVRDSYIHDTTGNGISGYQASDVTVTGSFFARVSSGGYFQECTGVLFEKSSVLDVQGPMPRGQLVQFNAVTGANNAVRCNVMENRPGESNPEDGINMFVSAGTASSPIVVEGNRIQGGGPSTSGGGILLGDGGKTSAYQISRFNVLIDPGQYGTAVAGGSHMTLEGNTLFARKQPFTNVGIYVWDQYASSCTDVTVKNNVVDWTNKDGAKNPWWNPGNCGAVTETADDFKATVDPSIVAALPAPCR